MKLLFCFVFFFSSVSLTCVPEFFVPVHGQDDEDVSQDVHHDGEDQHAGQRSGQSRRRALSAAARVPGQTLGTVLILELQIHLCSRWSGHTGGGGGVASPVIRWTARQEDISKAAEAFKLGLQEAGCGTFEGSTPHSASVRAEVRGER